MPRLTERAWYRRAEWAWYALALGYDVFWIAVIGSVTAPYGVRIPILAVIVVVCSVPYAYSTARLVRAALERKSDTAAKWALLAAAAFFAPDIYVVAAGGRRMPWYLLTGFLVWVTVAAAIGVRSVQKKIAQGRAERAAEIGAPDIHADSADVTSTKIED